jgi:hypothetical protein
MYDGRAVGTIDVIEKKTTVNYGVFTSKIRSFEFVEAAKK